jgi:hypothetical protein
MKTKIEREYEQCPNCEEKDLVHNIDNKYQCNNCDCIWDEVEDE